MADESDVGNNCSAAVSVTVAGNGDSGEPDLVVESPTASDENPAPGGAFTLSAVVRNQGDGGSTGTMLRYYRSSNATITTRDTEVGTDAVNAIAAAGSSTQSIDLTASTDPGTYYYGACVDDVEGESDIENNCSGAVTVTVAEDSGTPDLLVRSPAVDDAGPESGGTFTFSATVANDGDARSAATTLRYYRSTNATISRIDTEVGSADVAELPASGTVAESIGLTAPASPGTYHYGACVDAVEGESDTANNCSAGVAVTVAGQPDLVVESPSASESEVGPGGSFTLSATVRNRGDGEASATTLRYYRSTNATISRIDTEVGTADVAELPVSGTVAESIGLTAPASPGTYHYGACVDAVEGESDTANNCSAGVAVTVAGQPDLVVESPSASESEVGPGGSFTLSATVRNRGDGEASATTLRYYRSTDTAISSGDTEVGTADVAELPASGTVAESIGLTAPASPGTYHYGACVDAVEGESDTANNCSAGVAVTVAGQPDLVVESPSASESEVGPGGSFTLSATVRNRGDGEASATTLRYDRSTDTAISSGDTEVGTADVAELPASGTVAESIGLTAPASPGTYHYGACVDAVEGESDTANNCSAGVAVTVAGQPDLVVESPSASESEVGPGDRSL